MIDIIVWKKKNESLFKQWEETQKTKIRRALYLHLNLIPEYQS